MKTKYAIYCVLIALAALSTPASADMLGDVNADGRITTADSLLVLAMAAGSVAPDLERADVNADGRVDSLDALMIQMIAQKTQVCVNSPEVVSGAFEVTIDVHNADDLDSGQFDLSFDPGVVTVTAVHDGDISGEPVPVESWDFVDADTIRVLFNLPGVTGVSGSGQITTISFEVTGSQGDSCVLDMSNGKLFDTEANEIPALWNDCGVAIGASVTVNAPEVVADAFEVTVDIENVTDLSCGQFDLTFDPGVVNAIDVGAGNIDGTTMPIVGWAFVDTDRIRVLFNLPGLGVVSGSGSVARIDFAITGSEGDVSILDISNGLLVDGGSEGIPANWVGDWVTIGELTPPPPTQVRVHNIDTGENFSSIQDAIDDPDTLNGHVIEVGDGVCYENVKVTRSLTIRSLNGSANCVVQAAKSNDAVFDVTADYVKISGFTVKGAMGWHKAGVCINASCCNVSSNNCLDNYCGISITGSNNTVSNNDCYSNNRDGIFISDSSNNTLSYNNCSSNDVGGINLLNSSDNIVSNNVLSHNIDGIFVEGSDNIISNNTCSENGNGLYLFGPDSVGNIIRNNTIRSNNGTGIQFGSSSYNDFHRNKVHSNGCGICICQGSSSNLVYLNNFVNNSENVRSLTERAVWNSSQKINYTYSDSSYMNYMGNHWSDYNGTDVDGDGLGDTPYIITGMNNDTRPLMEPFESYHFRLISDVGVQEVYNRDTGENFSSIQAAINDRDTRDGDTILVGAGTYNEHPEVHKRLKLYGVRMPVVDAGEEGDAITVNADGCLIDGFRTTGEGSGISVESGNNTIRNNIVQNTCFGICLCSPGNNTLRNNTGGISLLSSGNNKLTGNRMIGDRCNFGVLGDNLSDFIQNIDTSNKINGRPIYYWINREDQQVPYDAGYVGIVNCTNITARNLTLSTNLHGILLAHTNDSRIEYVNASGNALNGIKLVHSSNNTIANSTGGIILQYSSNNNIISNNIFENYKNIYLWCSDSNTLKSNDCNHIEIYGCHNIVSGNRIHDHVIGVSVDGVNNIVEGNICESLDTGIHSSGTNTTIRDNEIRDCICGIRSDYCGMGTAILNNSCESLCGFCLCDAPNSTISGNRIESVYDCISIMCSPNSTVADNTMIGRGLSIRFDDIDGDDTEAYGNVLNGEPLVFLKGVRDEVVDRAAQAFLVDCMNVTVRSIDFNDVAVGAYLRNSSQCIIEDNVCEGCSYGIYLDNSYENLVQENTCNNGTQSRWTSFIDGGDGIHLDNSADNNTVINNTCRRNDDEGIDIWCSSNNTVTRNRICGNMGGGLDLMVSDGNVIYLNDFMDNAESSCIIGSNLWSSSAEINYTYDGKIFTNYLGNYWDDYEGNDADNDGIGDSPYSIDPDRDDYPLVMPIENYFVETENIQEQKEV